METEISLPQPNQNFTTDSSKPEASGALNSILNQARLLILFSNSSLIEPILNSKPFHLRFKTQLVILICFVMSIFSDVSIAKIKKQAQLPKETVEKMNLILRVNEALHAALISGNEALIETQIRALELSVEDSLDTFAKREREHNRHLASQPQLHDKNLTNMLSDIRRALKSAHTSGGSKRRDYLRDSFRQVALLTKLYQFSHPYKIFFCKIDRSVWLQRGSKPKNPILADTAPSCGIPVK